MAGRFAPDGRFVLYLDSSSPINAQVYNLIDTVTERELELERHYLSDSSPGYRDGFGWVAVVYDWATEEYHVRLLPPLTDGIRPDLLELWARVAVCGELGEDGQFHQWDESTWGQRQMELAAEPVPWPEFPFPGYVATDRLHWLRAEFANATDQTEKSSLATELLKRAETAGDNAEAVRWHAWLTSKAQQVEPLPKGEVCCAP